jgi:hypothetical protein
MKLSNLISAIEDKGLDIRINQERPIYVQPEDRILYRAHRILIILGNLNRKKGLSKNVVACIDFLLRNTAYQRDFVIQYFKDQKNLAEKFSGLNVTRMVEIDYNVVQYKSVPWDLRYNDMFLYLLVRNLIEFIGTEKNPRVILSVAGFEYMGTVEEFFPDEMNFVEIFGKSLIEERAIDIITNVIPKSYWKENEKSVY